MPCLYGKDLLPPKAVPASPYGELRRVGHAQPVGRDELDLCIDRDAAGREEPHWQVRVGLHQGPVVAGIVGRRKFHYDLWGDTVNVAARITERAGAGGICMSDTTWRQVQNAFPGKNLGPGEIKGKGAIELVEVRNAG